MVVVDAGSLLWKSAKVREGELPERQLKAQLIVDAYRLSGVDALTPGPADLALGVDFYRELTDGLPVLAGNLVCGQVSWPLTRTVEAGGHRVGLIGVVDEVPADCSLTEPAAQAAARGVAELAEVDLVVLLSQSRVAADAGIASQVQGLDFVVNGFDRQTWKNPRGLDNGAFGLGAGSRGKKVGVLKLSPVAGAQGWQDSSAGEEISAQLERMRVRVADVEADRDAAADDTTRERLDKRAAYYQGEVERLEGELAAARATDGGQRSQFSNRLVDLDDGYDGHEQLDLLVYEAKSRLSELEPERFESGELEGPWVGTQHCRGCHMEQYTQWEGTGHARAYASLEASKRQLDSDCYTCHVTGAGKPGGPSSAHQVGALTNVGCESCHGPGEAHLDQPVATTILGKPGETICKDCHDGDQDGGRFDLPTYLPKVIH